MRLWKPLLAVALAAGAVLALAVTLFARINVVDVLVMILIGPALVGMYLLRRDARAKLVYNPHGERRRQPSRHAPEQTRNVALPAGRADPTGSGGPGAVRAFATRPSLASDRDVSPARYTGVYR
jgi:hypothetical protein